MSSRPADRPASPPTLLDLDVYLLSRVGKAGRAAVAARLAEYGLRLWHMAVLAVLRDFGPQDQRSLGERLALHPSDVAKVVDALARDGRVRRERTPADRRRVTVDLTEHGRELLTSLHREAAAVGDRLLSALTPGERETLRGLLRRVTPPPGTP
ncbi:MarR family winged helix-turn-helix transcriptional regulator [Streptomyces sp. NPDC059740]|uniref:MarR family winged helix-turn-helix transcriptional regulator n=1 Tax=Streptomyces sp. NPDC059740 TaxID=3346926 RepID=UPI00365702B1